VAIGLGSDLGNRSLVALSGALQGSSTIRVAELLASSLRRLQGAPIT